jgi:hypothetical protein
VATFDDLREIAMRLPDVYEEAHIGGPCFRANDKQFAMFWQKEQRTVLKLPKDLQRMLFDAVSETFGPVRVGSVNWSYVELENLNKTDLEHYVTHAWRTVVPERLSDTI